MLLFLTIAHNVLFDFTCILFLFFSSHLVGQLILSLVFGNMVYACQHFDVQDSQFIPNTFQFLFFKVSSFSSLINFFLSCLILRGNTQSVFKYQVRRSSLVFCNYLESWVTIFGHHWNVPLQ